MKQLGSAAILGEIDPNVEIFQTVGYLVAWSGVTLVSKQKNGKIVHTPPRKTSIRKPSYF